MKRICLGMILAIISSTSVAGPSYVSGKITSLLAHGTDHGCEGNYPELVMAIYKS